jgi:NAD(P)H-dependent FMN reductase
MARLLFFAGSARKDSINKKLAKCAAELAREKGADVTFIDLKDFEMPIYDGDLEDEKGLPENARRLKQLFIDHDGFFIASPEYNSSFSPLLKNSLDWISRVGDENEKPMMAYSGKVAALAATSPGGLGGLRGLVSLRMMLGNVGVTVIPKQAAIGSGFQAFNDDGGLVDEAQARMLESVIDALINATDRMSG